MSKAKYAAPELNIITFQTADIIATSGEPIEDEVHLPKVEF